MSFRNCGYCARFKAGSSFSGECTVDGSIVGLFDVCDNFVECNEFEQEEEQLRLQNTTESEQVSYVLKFKNATPEERGKMLDRHYCVIVGEGKSYWINNWHSIALPVVGEFFKGIAIVPRERVKECHAVTKSKGNVFVWWYKMGWGWEYLSLANLDYEKVRV